MAERIQAIRGMNDILPEQMPLWSSLEAHFKTLMQQYGYQEIRFPLVESTQLFKRSIGEVTDIVEKEMYTFTDLNGESISLRPEGTAGCVRACLEHGLLHNQQQKLWYNGPMFRHEKPQKGRYRQFNQFGVETFGFSGIAIELEALACVARFWKKLNITKHIQLQINTLGTPVERQHYRAALVQYFTEHRDALDEDSKRRLTKNPLRILDSKNPDLAPLLSKSPKLMDFLSPASKKHFDDLCLGLEALGIDYVTNTRLVRGLDYYNHTVFEWVTDKLGSQATVCGGGRYDGLVAALGGSEVPCFGFSMGVERLILLLEALEMNLKPKQNGCLFLMASTDAGLEKNLILAEQLRDVYPHWTVITNNQLGSFKSQFKKADKSGADFALVLGDSELSEGTIGIKNLREPEEQRNLSQAELIPYLSQRLESE